MRKYNNTEEIKMCN